MNVLKLGTLPQLYNLSACSGFLVVPEASSRSAPPEHQPWIFRFYINSSNDAYLPGREGPMRASGPRPARSSAAAYLWKNRTLEERAENFRS